MSVRQSQESWEAESGRNSEFVWPYRIIELELEVTHEAKIKPLAAVEDVLMVVWQLRRDSEKSCRVGRGLKVDLETLELWLREVDAAVDLIGIDWGHADIDAAEHAQRWQSRVSIVDYVGAIGLARSDGVQFLEDLFPYLQALWVRYADLVERELADRTVHVRTFVTGIAVDSHLQNRRIRSAQGVRFKEEVVLAELVISHVPKSGACPYSFVFKDVFREIVADLNGHCRGVS